MAVFLSILRGINVSGQKKIVMKDLKALYESLGFGKVATYIQSGNVVFEHEQAADTKVMEVKIKQEISKKYGFDVPVFVKTFDELLPIVNENPFLKKENIETDKLHVTFLADFPKQEMIDKILAVNYLPDQFIIVGKEIYLYCPEGYGNTKLSHSFFESKLKVTATTRNWKTVNELFGMMQNI